MISLPAPQATQSESIVCDPSFTRTDAENSGRKLPVGMKSAEVSGDRSTERKTSRYDELNKVKDRPQREEPALAARNRLAKTGSQTTARAKIAKRMLEVVIAMCAPDPAFAATKIQVLKAACVDAHRELGGGSQEDFLSLVVWLEGATAGSAWRLIAVAQWEAVRGALLTAYEVGQYRYDEFVAAKRAMKAAGLAALPPEFCIDGAD